MCLCARTKKNNSYEFFGSWCTNETVWQGSDCKQWVHPAFQASPLNPLPPSCPNNGKMWQAVSLLMYFKYIMGCQSESGG